MKRRYRKEGLRVILIGAAMLAALPAGARAQSMSPAPAGDMTAGKVDVKSMVLADLKETREKIVSLAQAVPEDKYGWNPGPGVRSVGETYMHIVATNFTFPEMWGVPPPPAKDLNQRPFPKKERVIQLLNTSFDYLQNSIKRIPDSRLNEPRDFFGTPMPLADILFHIAGHEHEHLGQSIAYARMNGVAPPWSAPEKPASTEQKPKQ
jgi:uncharacterized damage-inducible protein DinB